MSAPTAAFTRLSEHVGGQLLVTLYELSVLHPTAQTWYLAETNLDADALYSGSPAYQGLVADGTSQPESAVAIGGASAVPGLTLVLADHPGTYRGQGARRRFSDQFTERVAGYSEPYDLASAELLVRLAWVAPGLTSADRLTVGRYTVVPGAIRRAGDTLTLECESDPTLYRPLPVHRVTGGRWVHAPDESRGKAVPLVFGSDYGPGAQMFVPAIPVGPGGLGGVGDGYLFAMSPSGTPSSILQLVGVWNFPLDGQRSLQDIQNGLGVNPILATVQNTHALESADTDVVESFVLTQSILCKTVRVWFDAETTTGVPVELRIEYGFAGYPSGDLIDEGATSKVTVTDTGTGVVYVGYEFGFDVPPWLPAGHELWLVMTVGTPTGAGAQIAFRGRTPGTYSGAHLFRPGHTGPWIESTNDLDVEIDAVEFTDVVSLSPLPGEQVKALRADVVLGDRPIGARMAGMVDDGSGTYTGTAGARIENGADILRWLMRAPSGLGLDASRVDLASLDRARARLDRWHALAGVVYEAQDGRVWLSRVAKDCRSLVYENQDGQLAVYTDRGNTPMATPVRLVRAWEHGPLTVGNSAQGVPAAETLPWSAVEVFYARDLMGIERFRESGIPVPPGTRPTTEWDGYAVVSQDSTDPPDDLRQTQATALEARFGRRSNSGAQPGVTEGSAAYFTTAFGPQLRNDLFDRGALRPNPFDLIEVMLPRFALGFRLMDDVLLESYEFPSGSDRRVPGEVPWAGWAASEPWYTARRGLFQVRALALLAAHGTKFPVRATLILREWVTD